MRRFSWRHVKRSLKFTRARSLPRAIRQRLISGARSEAGDTLVEVLLALVVMGLALVAILGGFATSISATAEQRTVATGDTVLRSFVETATFEIQFSPSPKFQKCATDATYQPIAQDFTTNSSIAKQNKYSVSIPAGGVTSLGSAACNSSNPPPQSIKAVATSNLTGLKDSLTFVVAEPGSNPGTGSISVSTTLGGPGGQASGPWGGGTTVFISGTGFSAPAQVFFGTAQASPASVQVVSPTEITAVSPQMAGTTDPVHVTVVDSLGTSSLNPTDLFTYGPNVTGLSITDGPPSGGTTTTITGTGFSGVTEVDFVPVGLPDGSPGTAIACSTSTTSCTSGLNASTSLTVTSPPSKLLGVGAAGVVDVVVITPAGQSSSGNADHFTYGVSVTGLNPKSGPDTGGTTVVISGFGFNGVGTIPGTSVTFGGVVATVQNVPTNSDTQLTVTSPASGIGPGSVDVVVNSPTGTSATTPSDQFTYNAGPLAGIGIDLVGTKNTVSCASGKKGTSCATPANGFCVISGGATSTTCQISGVTGKNGTGSAVFYVETVDAQGSPTNEDSSGNVTTSALTITVTGTGATPPSIQIPAGASTTSPNTVTVTGNSVLTMGSYTLNISVK